MGGDGQMPWRLELPACQPRQHGARRAGISFSRQVKAADELADGAMEEQAARNRRATIRENGRRRKENRKWCQNLRTGGATCKKTLAALKGLGSTSLKGGKKGQL